MLDVAAVDDLLRFVPEGLAYDVRAQLKRMEQDADRDVTLRQLEYLRSQLLPPGATATLNYLAPTLDTAPVALTPQEMARLLARRGGLKRSERKTAAARANGKRGGSPTHRKNRPASA